MRVYFLGLYMCMCRIADDRKWTYNCVATWRWICRKVRNNISDHKEHRKNINTISGHTTIELQMSFCLGYHLDGQAIMNSTAVAILKGAANRIGCTNKTVYAIVMSAFAFCMPKEMNTKNKNDVAVRLLRPSSHK